MLNHHHCWIVSLLSLNHHDFTATIRLPSLTSFIDLQCLNIIIKSPDYHPCQIIFVKSLTQPNHYCWMLTPTTIIESLWDVRSLLHDFCYWITTIWTSLLNQPHLITIAKLLSKISIFTLPLSNHFHRIIIPQPSILNHHH